MRQVFTWIYICLSATTLLVAPPASAAGVDAVVEWSRRVELSVPVSGVIVQVHVDAGDRVKRGQALLVLDAAPFQAALKQAQALVAQRKLERDDRQRDYRQAKELYERTVLSTVEFENARTQQARTEAAYQEAQAMLDDRRYRLRVSTLRAPFDGVVLQRLGQPGQTVATDLKPPILLVVAAAGEYIARARLPAERIAGLKAGQGVSVQVLGEKFSAKVKNAGLEPLAQTSKADAQYEVDVVFETPHMLRAGQRAIIEIP